MIIIDSKNGTWFTMISICTASLNNEYPPTGFAFFLSIGVINLIN